MATEREPIDAIVGVYDADGTVLGELRYVVGRALGRTHCALCDITHGTLRRKPELDEALACLGVPVELLHRDEQPPALGSVTAGRLPCVAARRGGGYEVIVERPDLEACAGQPGALVAAIQRGLAGAG